MNRSRVMNGLRAGVRAFVCVALPPCAVALGGPDSTTVSGLIPGSSLLVDHTGDCFVTDTDVGVSTLLQLAISPVVDVDGDGVVTAADRVATFEKLILKSFGDVNGDGVVGLEDMSQAAADVPAGDPQADANTDGVVDADDVIFIAGLQGSWTPAMGQQVLSNAAMYLDQVVGQIEAEGGANAFIGVESCAGEGEPSPADHRRLISDSWYPEHEREFSRLWPVNHYYSISATWDTYDHSIQTSHDGLWPAEHEGKFSRTWTDEPDGPWDYEHTFTISQAHPGDHSIERSRLWQYAPGHLYSRSQTWPTDQLVHARSTSWSWPPNHFYEISVDGGVSSHEYEFSNLDWPGDHSVNRSQDWPPSHTWRVSQSWHPAHAESWSFRWPPSHDAMVSSTWDPGSYPIGWPPNHTRARSDADNAPGPWDEFWPPDHTRWDSIRDILDVVPPLLPDQWWPLGG